MRITRDIIETKLSNFFIPQRQCDQKAFQIASILLDQEIKSFPETRYNSISDVMAEISNALTNERIAIIWLDTGATDPSNPFHRALHCYFVFEDNPLQSFAIWETPGAVFYDDAYTKNKIVETINLFKDVGLHVVPPSLI